MGGKDKVIDETDKSGYKCRDRSSRLLRRGKSKLEGDALLGDGFFESIDIVRMIIPKCRF